MVQPNGVGLTKELDYQEEDINKRIGNVESLLKENDKTVVNYYDNYFNVNINKNKFLSDHDTMSKQIERMATYILFLDKEESKDSNSPNLSEKDLYNRRKREVDMFSVNRESNDFGNEKYEDLDSISLNLEKMQEEKNEKNSYLDTSVQVTGDDLYLFPEMTEYFKFLGVLRFNKIIGKSAEGVDNIEIFAKMPKDKMLKMYPEEKREKLKELTKKNNPNIESNIHSDLKDTKIMLSNMFYFKRFAFSRREDKYKNFSFHQEEHVDALIQSLPMIKSNGVDLTSEEGILVYVLDDLMKSDKVDYINKKIYGLHAVGYQVKEIEEVLNYELGVNINQRAINRIINNTLPKIITDLYSDSFQDWYYTFVEKGKYKKCSNCEQVFLATENNFHKDLTGKYGLKQSCKKCVNSKIR